MVHQQLSPPGQLRLLHQPLPARQQLQLRVQSLLAAAALRHQGLGLSLACLQPTIVQQDVVTCLKICGQRPMRLHDVAGASWCWRTRR